MFDCSNCTKAIEVSPSQYVCDMGSEKFVISDYPSQGVNCKALEQKQDGKQRKSKDPLLTFLNKRKIIKTPEIPKEIPTQPVNPKEEINFKYALGWITSAILGGILLASLFFGLIG